MRRQPQKREMQDQGVNYHRRGDALLSASIPSRVHQVLSLSLRSQCFNGQERETHQRSTDKSPASFVVEVF
jgi:hypothetical protein